MQKKGQPVRWLTWMFVLATALTPFLTHGQTGFLSGSIQQTETLAAQASQDVPDTEDVERQIGELNKGLQEAEAALVQQRNRASVFEAQQHPLLDLVDETTQTMAWIVVRYKHALDGLNTLQRLTRELDQKQKALMQWRPPAGGPPWPIEFADETYLSMTESRALEEVYRDHSDVLLRHRETVKKERQELEKRIRLAQEDSSIASNTLTEAQSLSLANLQASLQLASLELVLTDFLVQTNALYVQIATLNHEFSQKDWQYMDGRVAITQEVYDRILTGLEAEVASLKQAQERIRLDNIEIIERYDQAVTARQALELTAGADPQALIAAQRKEVLASDHARLQSMRLNEGFFGQEMIRVRQDLWGIRFGLIQGEDGDDRLYNVRTAFASTETDLLAWREYLTARLDNLRKERKTQLESAAVSESDTEQAFLRERSSIIQQQIDVDVQALEQIESTKLLLDLTRQDLARYSDKASAKQKLLWAVDSLKSIAQKIWDFELLTVTDSVMVQGRPITTVRSVTIGKSFGALFILLFGIVLIKRLVSRALSLASRRSKLQASTAMIIGQWIVLFAGMTLIIFSLTIVNIPLSVFAFAGGALAIGIGFGAQHLLQNLISGLMLLIEKPVRVGDWIEVGGVTGVVTSIGIRFSTLLSPTGAEHLIPNSVLVEEKLVNWTYSSPQVRREIDIGVGSINDAQTVINVLLAVAQDHPMVLEQPQSRVLLDSLSDQGMLFKLQFWVSMSADTSGSLILSELRQEIHARFTEYNITFA